MNPRELAIEQAKVLYWLIEMAQASKIKETFIAAFLDADVEEDGIAYLRGNFNTTGTKSGRLSSNSPNMQNLPSSGTIYAKTVKECFSAPNGWIMAGADFDSLEDKISALTTKDPNKLKVYTEGYDGHSLRAFAYSKNSMPDIEQKLLNEEKRYFSIKTKGGLPYLVDYATIVVCPDGIKQRIGDYYDNLEKNRKL